MVMANRDIAVGDLVMEVTRIIHKQTHTTNKQTNNQTRIIHNQTHTTNKQTNNQTRIIHNQTHTTNKQTNNERFSGETPQLGPHA